MVVAAVGRLFLMLLLSFGGKEAEVPEFELAAGVGGEDLRRTQVDDAGHGKTVGACEAQFRPSGGGGRVAGGRMRKFGPAGAADAEIEHVQGAGFTHDDGLFAFDRQS